MHSSQIIHSTIRSLGLALLFTAGTFAGRGAEPVKPKEPPVSAEQYAKWQAGLERAQQQLQAAIAVQEDRLAKAKTTQETAEASLADLEQKKADAEAAATEARHNSYSWTDSNGNVHYNYRSHGSLNPPPTRMGEGAAQKALIAQAQAEAGDAERKLTPLRKQLADVEAKLVKLQALMTANPAPEAVTPVATNTITHLDPPEAAATSDETLYSQALETKMLLYGRLVEKSTLKAFTGFLRRGPIDTGEGQGPQDVWLLNLAKRKATGEKAPWKPSDELMVLVGYEPVKVSENIVKVSGIELDPIGKHRALAVARPPTFAEWQKLRPHE